jgi:hypothetical protein
VTFVLELDLIVVVVVEVLFVKDGKILVQLASTKLKNINGLSPSTRIIVKLWKWALGRRRAL